MGTGGEFPCYLTTYPLGPALGKIRLPGGLGPRPGGTKPDTDPPRPFGQNLADEGRGASPSSAFGGGVGEGFLEEASMVVRWKKREEHSKLEEQPVQKP